MAKNVVPLAPAQDYKRIGEGDEGPNTGGMGSPRRSPGSRTTRSSASRTSSTGRSSRRWPGAALPFHGVLYAGLMMTAAGPKVLRVQHPLRRPRDAGGAAAAAQRPPRALLRCPRAGRPGGAPAEFGSDWAVTVVLASAGHRILLEGDVISGLEQAAAVEGSR